EALPAWVEAFNQGRPADGYYGQDWAEGDKTYLALGSESGAPDADFYGQIPFTPYGNELVLQFARALVEQEELGADEVTDFLSIGLSANDFAGHRWGPYSEEVAAMTRATDRQLAALLAFLDEKVGAGKYWLALSADHGVAPALAQARARGLPAKGVDPRALLEAVEKALDDAWGEDEWLLPRAGLVFNREALKKHEVGVAQAAHVAGGAVMAIEGVRGYVAGAETLLDAATTKAVRLSTYRGRTPDVFVVLEPFAMFGGEGRGTVAVHGTHYAYDQHVPLVFYGPAFRAGVYWERVATIDLAPTLAAALGLTPPALSSGKVLTQALRSE
ncbi:MAG: alkaline phosphatase family protein, partial [Terriglobia bacterium]